MAEPKEREVVRYVEVEKKKAPVEKFNVWASAPKSEWQWVEIPAEDLHSFAHPDISINSDKFEAGKKYFVPPLLVGEINRILKRFEVECISLLQPRKRQAALSALKGKGTNLASVGAQVVGDPGTVDAMPGA